MSLALHIVGFTILIIGLAMAATLLDVPRQWIVVIVVILAGIGVLSASRNIRNHEP